MQFVHLAVEGPTDEAVGEKLLEVAGLSPYLVGSRNGKRVLDQRLSGYNQSAIRVPWLVIRDLDRDDNDECIPDLCRRLLGGVPSPGMCFRLAVREVESWLMADRTNCSSFFGVLPKSIPTSVDVILDPKQSLVNLCRRSRKRDMKQGMVPRPDSKRIVGPEYTALVREFVRDSWDPEAARANSQSLDRALRCLYRLREWMTPVT